eukprot:TRINITY_DN98020_c0_g1_i1.p1 TRINITY_DN98020_c0_g1~~TRINITY_DN98020_c0_g1_i1.p1  ORF type:complete len:192 (+),score=49.65 TRINITY_DN98020_c0_g1_i1:11-586(+)
MIRSIAALVRRGTAAVARHRTTMAPRRWRNRNQRVYFASAAVDLDDNSKRRAYLQQLADKMRATEQEAEDDDHVYVPVQFLNPATGESRTVMALVDTGSTHSELRQSLCEALGLRVVDHVRYQTNNGYVTHGIVNAKIRVADSELVTTVSQSPEQDFLDGSNTDEAVIGCMTLAELDVLVDCRRKRLVRNR